MTYRHTVVAALAVAALSAPSLAQDAKPKTTFTGDLGYVDATGNTRLTTLNAGEKLGYTDGQWTLSQLGAYVYGQTNGTSSANQLRFAGRADFAFESRFTGFFGASYERNTFAGFNSRVDEIAGVSWKAIVAADDSLGLDVGGDLTQEADVSGVNQNYPAARAAGNYRHFFSKTAYFQQIAEYLPNLKTSGEYRVNTESSLVAPISAHIGIKASYAIRYDSRPPAKFGTTDRVVTTGIQISF